MQGFGKRITDTEPETAVTVQAFVKIRFPAGEIRHEHLEIRRVEHKEQGDLFISMYPEPYPLGNDLRMEDDILENLAGDQHHFISFLSRYFVQTEDEIFQPDNIFQFCLKSDGVFRTRYHTASERLSISIK